jgi:hypothetical protein
MMKKGAKRARLAQLMLFRERAVPLPQWQDLDAENRAEIVRLLAQILCDLYVRASERRGGGDRDE